MGTTIEVTDYIFPIFVGKIEEGEFRPINIVGTAFYLNEKYFLTANHVLQEAIKHDFMALGVKYKDDTYYKFATVTSKFDFNPDYDIALFETNGEVEMAKSFKWTKKSLDSLLDVQSFGYPFGFNIDDKSATNRSFKGYVISNCTFPMMEKNPKIYELSFACPRGLSGAPLVTRGDNPRIVGFIYGNHGIEIETYREVETFKDEGEKVIYNKMETTTFGIAIQVSNLFDIPFPQLEMTLGEYLTKNNLFE